MIKILNKIKKLWIEIYGENHISKFNKLIEFLNETKNQICYTPKEKNWYKTGLIYSTYVDHFAIDFKGMINKLDYLKEIGVTILWLLPILESPMKDQGFDISDYYTVRKELGGNEELKKFIEEAHKKNIKIIFDIAINHCSEDNEWFKEAKMNKNSKYRDYFIWSENKEKFKETRILFKGIMESNWEYNSFTDDYYFHRFYETQPDLNYANPDVLIEMIKIFSFWKKLGIDGFRMDAVPFLWKKEETNCENLLETHKIIKIFRLALDYLGEGTILVAEANQMPKDVVEYFGDSDECHTAYHFPLMPMFYLSIAEENPKYILEVLDEKITPNIPEDCQWFTFLRCHDELTLEFVNDIDRTKILDHFLLDKRWNFREGEGISGRIYNIFNKNIKKVLLAYSLLFSVRGTPINYYGDEIAMENNEEFYLNSIKFTGYSDSRFFNRGSFDNEKLLRAKKDVNSDSYKIFNGIKEMTNIKSKETDLFLQKPHLEVKNKTLISKRVLSEKKLTIYNNLSSKEVIIDNHCLKPYEYKWILN